MPRVFHPAAFCAASVGAALLWSAATARVPSLSVLTVGGGPRPDHNQVAIESNVRYVADLLPTGTRSRVLFADGNPQTPCVLYSEPVKLSEAEQAFRALLGQEASVSRYRAPRLPAQDGPSQEPAIHTEIARLADEGSNPTLLYFTGHGDRQRNLDNNVYALWEGKPEAASQTPGANGQSDAGLSVRDLAAELARLPAEKPVTLVMVQCFSGSFGNILFENGDPAKPLTNRPVCGFFATTRERTAAGCTPEINEADYKDFTSYFFAALSGRDRTGKAVTGADYNRDGRVGMNEAFAYALVTEPSADVPVATTDVFLRRFVPVSDDEIAQTPYSAVRRLAGPAQQAALDGLSRSLGETGEDRLQTALADVRARAGSNTPHHGGNVVQREARETYEAVQRDLVARFPGLKQKGDDRESAERQAVAYLQTQPDTVRRVRDAARVWQARSDEQLADELRGVRYLRLLRVAKSVVLENKLRKGSDRALVASFDRLRALESGNPLR